MSLLLEALKKAEKAKEEAQRRAQQESGGETLRLEPTLEEERAEEKPAEPKPVLTRAELPDIHQQPLEILTDDIAPKPQPAPAPEPTLAPPPPPRGTSSASAPRADAQAAERATARKVFEAKFREPNPRLPFYLTLGALGVFALGTVAYFWVQLRPPPALVNANPPRTGNEAPATALAQAPLPAAAAAPVRAPLIPGLPDASAAPPAAAARTAAAPAAVAPAAATPPPAAPAKVAPAKAEPAATPPPAKPRRVARRTEPAAPPAAPAPALKQRRRPVLEIHPKVQSGYAAYLAGDLAAAREDYQAALKSDSDNRDALLGLAAVDMRTGRFEAAEATYLRLLQLDPNDAHAQAGLISLRTARLDPLATESRLKSMLATAAEGNVLHFTLGNQLARQGRWAEAQEAYFKAFAAAPANADFAYNLAVSLDHLRQRKHALEYYQRAIGLAAAGAATFDLGAARARAAQLAAP